MIVCGGKNKPIKKIHSTQKHDDQGSPLSPTKLSQCDALVRGEVAPQKLAGSECHLRGGGGEMNTSGMRRGWHLGGSLVVPEKVAAAHLIEDAEARQMLLPQRSRGPGGGGGSVPLWGSNFGETPCPSQMSTLG